MLRENLELLANERDPKTGYTVEDTILKSAFNKKVLRDAAEMIDQMIKIDFDPTRVDRRRKHEFYIPHANRASIEISAEPLTISAFTYKLNALIDEKRMKKLKASQITAWLMREGYLSEIESEDGRKFKVLTEKSASIGISAQEKTSPYGRVYTVNYYNDAAQGFIIQHLDQMIIAE